MQKYLFTEDRGIFIDTALNYLLLFPEDTHTPNKCEAHCEQWEIGHLGERWQPDFRIQTTIQTTCVLKPFRNTLLWNTVQCMDLYYDSDAVY